MILLLGGVRAGRSELPLSVWPMAPGDGDAILVLALPQGAWSAGKPATVRMSGTVVPSGVSVTSTHPDGSVRTGAMRVAITGAVANVPQPGTLTIGEAGPTREWSAPTWGAIGDTTVAAVQPFTNAIAVGGVTDAAMTCASGVLGALRPRAQNPSIAGMASYETTLDRCLADFVEAQSAGAIGGLLPPIQFASASYQYDRPLLCYRAWARTGDVRWLARGVQTHACLRALGATIGAGIEWQWGEPFYGWESQMALGPLWFGDVVPRAAEVGYVANISTSSDWWVSANDTRNFAQGRFQSQVALRFWCLVQSGIDPASNGRTAREWLRDWAVRVVGSPAWDAPAAGQSRYRADYGAGFNPDNFNFHTALLLDMLQRVVELGDLTAPNRATVVARVQSHLEFLWATQWGAAELVPSFRTYTVEDNPLGATRFAPDLNGLFPHVFAWMARETGNALWRDRADAIIATWPANDARGFLTVAGTPDNQARGKVLQESYTWSQLTFGLRD